MSQKVDQKVSQNLGRQRHWSRRLAVQALYQFQISDTDRRDLVNQFRDAEEFHHCDAGFFEDLVTGVTSARESLDEQLGGYLDRPVIQLDPVEHAILWIGFYEFRNRLDTPYRVVIDEGVELAKRFGAQDGHRFVNAVLDRAAPELRAEEVGSARRGA